MRWTGVGSSRQRGFTLIELAFVIAIIGVLAGVAMPSFFTTSGKSKAAAEVGTVFSDLRVRLDQYHLENGAYPPTQTEAATWPTTPGATAQTVFPLPLDWGPTVLKVVLSDQTDLYCGYAWITGRSALFAGVPRDVANVGPIGTALGVVPGEQAWYYLFAHCNIDGDSSVDGYYVSDSINTTIRSQDPGH